MIRRTAVVVFVSALVIGGAPHAFAQGGAVAQLVGAVTDESGGVLPGVDVTVTHTDTGLNRSVVTGTKGEYVFPNLPVGPYKLSAKLQGFSSFEQSGILLSVGDTRAVNVILKVGAMSETILVSADAGLVETRSVSVGSVTPQELIVGLPLNGRSATQLILLNGGAVEGGVTAGNRGYPGQVAISVAGGTGTSTQYLVDGGYNNDPSSNAGNAIPFPDALQEFRTETGVRDARYGMSTGATVNAVTKSGTNTFHGNAFEFLRDHQFNAIRFFERTQNGGLGRDDGLHRDQFGGTLGGPVMKDKLFFFEGIQATKTRIAPLSANNIVPTADMLKGDFSKVMSAACRGGTARTLGAPYVDNKIDPALFHPLSVKIMSMLPVADPALDPDGCGRYPFAQANDSLDQQYVSRADYQMTKDKRVFFRDFYSHYNHPAAFDKNHPNLLQTTGNGLGNRATQHTISTGMDYVVTPHLFSSTRVSYQHTFSIRYHGEGVPTLGMLGVNAWMYTTGKIPGQDTLRAGVIGSSFTGTFYADTPSVSQDVDWTRGAHSISFGGSWTRPASNGDGPFQADGAMTFNGLITSGTTQASGGLDWADFVLGYPQNYRGGGSQINNAYVHSPGFYGNDVWRISSNFTMNYGLRWEPYFAPKDANGFNTGFSRENFEKGVRSIVYPNAPVGLLFAGDPGFPDNGANTWNHYNQLAPRFGLVWDPGGDSKQTIRGGVGVYYDSPKLWTSAHHMLNAPFGNTVDALRPGAAGALVATCPGKPSKNGCPVDFLNPWSATPGGDPHAALAHQGEAVILPGKNATFPVNGVYVSMPVDAHPMQSYQYNLSYQRQLGARMLLDVTYTGNQQRHIWTAGYNENPSVYIPGNCKAGQYGLTADGPCSNTTPANRQARAILTLLNPTEGALYGNNNVEQAYMDATGHYNGLKLALQKRQSHGWSANANYTFSKCINQGEPTTDIGNTFPVPQIDPFKNPHPDPESNEGPCSQDRRHVFNLSSVLASPGLGTGIVNMITKDWQVGIIFQARTGSPLTIGVTNDNRLTGEGQQRAQIVPGVDPILDKPVWVANAGGLNTQLQWLNMAAFTNAAPGQYGNSPRGYIFGPGFKNTDLSFSRNVNLAGGRRVEIRVEAFNLFDTVNWANPNTTVDNANAGRITNTSGDPRIMQFALKWQF